MFPSPVRRSRTRTWTEVVVGVVVAILVGLFLYTGLDAHEIRRYEVDVVVLDDSSALVRETIDYDFAANGEHGIYRTIPLDPGADKPSKVTNVSAWSASAPADTTVVERKREVEIRIGGPEQTVRGLHRYVLEYRLTNVEDDGRLAYDAIGELWQVPIDEAVVRVRAPAALRAVRCAQGASLSTTRCDHSQVTGNQIVARATGLEQAGITIEARFGKVTSAPPTALPRRTGQGGGDPWWWLRHIALVIAVGALGYVAGLGATTRWIRRAGRDLAWQGAGGPVDTVVGGRKSPRQRRKSPSQQRKSSSQQGEVRSRRIGEEVGRGRTAIRSVPPSGLTPWQGGLLLDEEVRDDHRVAWLAQQALDGWIKINRGEKSLAWASNDRRSAPKPLGEIFNGRQKVALKRYDAHVAYGWDRIGPELADWIDHSDLWDFAAERRTRAVIARLATTAAVAAVLGGFGLWLTVGSYWWAALPVAAVGSVLVGAGVAALLNSGEVSVRTPEGVAKRRHVEGFRRFFEVAEGTDVHEAADRGELGLYTVWAVALGELDSWKQAVADAGLRRSAPGVAEARGYSNLTSMVWRAITPTGNLGGDSSGLFAGILGGSSGSSGSSGKSRFTGGGLGAGGVGAGGVATEGSDFGGGDVGGSGGGDGGGSGGSW